MVAVSYTPLPPDLRGRVQPVNDIFAAFANALDGFLDPAIYATGRATYGTAGGVADAYTVTLPTAPAAYVAGLTVSFIPPASNTGGSCTVDVNGLGAQAVLDFNGAAPEAGMLPILRVVTLRHNGTAFFINAVSVTTTVSDGVVTNAKLADMAEARIKGRADGAGLGVPVDLTPTQVAAILSGETLTVGTPATVSDALNETAADALYERQDARINFWSGAKESGRTFTNPFIYENFSSTTNPNSGRIYFVSVFFGESITLSHLGYRIGSGASGSSLDKIFLGIYSSLAGFPHELMHQTVQTAASSLSGDKEVAFTSPVTVSAGWYWLSFVVGGAASSDFRLNRSTAAVFGPNSQTKMLQTTATDVTWGTVGLPSAAPAFQEFALGYVFYLFAVAN